jgi:3-dehydroquinate dehydratase type I
VDRSVTAPAIPRICVTVGGATMAELRRARDEVRDADLVELRLDAVREPDAAQAVADRRLPVIVTCRPRWEGGLFEGSEDDRLVLLRRAWEAGAEYVDVEQAAPFAPAFLASTAGRRIVLSMHDFNGLPPDLGDRVRAMGETPAAVIKIAVRAATLSDAVEVFGLQRLLPGRELVAIGMGPGANACGRPPERLPLRGDRPEHGCVRCGRPADRPFTLACDAQRGVRDRRDRRGVSPARGR